MTVIEQRAYEAIIKMARKDEPDYWEKLKHQAAINAMQGILSNPNHALWERENNANGIAESANNIATALVDKLKSGSK